MMELPGGILTAKITDWQGSASHPPLAVAVGRPSASGDQDASARNPPPQQLSYLLSLITFYERPRPGLQDSRGGLRGHPLDAILLTKSGPRQVKQLPPTGPHGLDAWSPTPGVVWAGLIKACLCPVTARDPRGSSHPGRRPPRLRNAPPTCL